MKKFILFLIIMTCPLRADDRNFEFPFICENPEVYSGNFSILKDGTILIFYDEHVLQVEEVKHYEKCWCNTN